MVKGRRVTIVALSQQNRIKDVRVRIGAKLGSSCIQPDGHIIPLKAQNKQGCDIAGSDAKQQSRRYKISRRLRLYHSVIGSKCRTRSQFVTIASTFRDNALC